MIKKSTIRSMFPETRDRLFNYAWTKYLIEIGQYLDTTEKNDIESVKSYVDSIISTIVNNSRSSFYIYGK